MSHGLRARLQEWANWGRPPNIGYPQMSPMFGERSLKTPLYSPADCIAHIAEVERAICRIEPEERRLIIHRYIWRMTVRELAERWNVSRGTIWRKLEEAEGAVYHQLSC